jgi:hypothetical protein
MKITFVYTSIARAISCRVHGERFHPVSKDINSIKSNATKNKTLPKTMEMCNVEV